MLYLREKIKGSSKMQQKSMAQKAEKSLSHVEKNI